MRLAGKVKMGYYPTPPEVATTIGKLLKLSEKGKSYLLLDPCCGCGTALKIIAEELIKKSPPDKKVITYGIELDEQRFFKAKQTLRQVLLADAITEVMVSNKTFSLLFLNPPYDWQKTETEFEHRRIEMEFLTTYTEKLRPGGLLVFLCAVSFFNYKNLSYLLE
ncbi:MAG TPA: class I SAM-dependent methyltransferase, partial [Candidatus Pacearchaeota archaeon]|nr:class I SAM-dependent methyltransferase [Candidatus Pacearchaeota archaeon]